MAERHTDPRKNFAPRFLPWLLAMAMFAVYALTLNHWISFSSLGTVTKMANPWLPEVTNPLHYLATYPFRWLSESQLPIALNVFSAVCAALTLGLLARSVAILPQDRTDAQRKREHSDFSFLTIRSAWLPPVLAVLVCGLQLTFWEQATNHTGEMFDLLLFAFAIWSLLEYRLDEREGRLFLAALVYGASMAENWAMVGFFPLFLGAVVWMRGWSFFSGPFLRRMGLFGFAGLLFYLLLPLHIKIASDLPVTFWQTLKFNLMPQYAVLKGLFLFFLHPAESAEFLSVSAAYLFAMLLISLRWKPSFGDRSNMGAVFTGFIFHLVHGAFVMLLLWMAFDPAFGPRRHGAQAGASMLTFYYLGALSIGYFIGYFLLVFGEKEKAKRPKKSPPGEFLDPYVFAAACALAVVAAAGLAYRNLPQIKAKNDQTLWRYASLVEKGLPSGGGYLLSDNMEHLAIVHSALARNGRAKDFIPLSTPSLLVPAYHRFLHKAYPKMWPEIVSATQTNTLSPLGLIQVLAILAKTNDLYYLHPSSGYYFEQFYQEPHGLAYKMKTLPGDTFLPPKADKNLTAENEAFWYQVAAPSLALVEKAVAPVDINAPKTIGEKFLSLFHVEREQNQDAAVTGLYYSRCMDFWGVELQRAGELQKAAMAFATATNLNPDNAAATINADFNTKLSAGETVVPDLAKATTDRFSKFNTWNDLINLSGPFDEPSFCFKTGLALLEANGFIHQSVAQFYRVQELAPDFLPARYELARVYLMTRLPDRALDALQAPLSHPQQFGLTETNETPLNILAAAAYFQKNENERGARLLRTEMARHPEDETLVTVAVQVFIARGMFNDTLEIIDRQLKMTPDNLAALYARGYVCIQLKRYDDAVAALDRVLAVQADNSDALFNRAIANLDLDRLDAARADYTQLQQTYSNSVPIAYGLAEIAYRQHNPNEAVRNYQIYLAHANTNTDEAKIVVERLRELKK